MTLLICWSTCLEHDSFVLDPKPTKNKIERIQHERFLDYWTRCMTLVRPVPVETGLGQEHRCPWIPRAARGRTWRPHNPSIWDKAGQAIHWWTHVQTRSVWADAAQRTTWNQKEFKNTISTYILSSILAWVEFSICLMPIICSGTASGEQVLGL